MLTDEQTSAGLDLVAEWLATKGWGVPRCPEARSLDFALRHADDLTECKYVCDPAPTGPDAAARGIGPMLAPEWDWPSAGPTPTILLEGGPYDWAIDASFELAEKFRELGIFAEPYAGYALCLYPN